MGVRQEKVLLAPGGKSGVVLVDDGVPLGDGLLEENVFGVWDPGGGVFPVRGGVFVVRVLRGEGSICHGMARAVALSSFRERLGVLGGGCQELEFGALCRFPWRIRTRTPLFFRGLCPGRRGWARGRGQSAVERRLWIFADCGSKPVLEFVGERPGYRFVRY